MTVERQILAFSDRLGLSPAARLELGLQDARRRALRPVDLDRLSAEERLQLSELLEKAATA